MPLLHPWVSVACYSEHQGMETAEPFFAMCLQLQVSPQPLGGSEAVAADVEISWVACIGATHALIESYTCPISWVCYTWVACVSGAPGGSLWGASRGRAGLGAGD